GAEEERQREERRRAIEEEHVAVPLLDRIPVLPSERRSPACTRYRDALPVGCVLPVVERALDRVADDTAAAEVRTKMRAVRIENGHRAARRAKRDEIPSQHTLGERLSCQLAALAEQIPGRRIDRKAVGRRSCHRVLRHVATSRWPWTAGTGSDA